LVNRHLIARWQRRVVCPAGTATGTHDAAAATHRATDYSAAHHPATNAHATAHAADAAADAACDRNEKPGRRESEGWGDWAG
jgi:hypothetical protein